jgi:hypothetical protein
LKEPVVSPEGGESSQISFPLHFAKISFGSGFPRAGHLLVRWIQEPRCDRRSNGFREFSTPGFDRTSQVRFGVGDLPELPIPKHVKVTKGLIDIDGWVFPLSYVSKSLLVWLQASFIRWAKEDESERNREWLEGIYEAFQEGLAGKL